MNWCRKLRVGGPGAGARGCRRSCPGPLPGETAGQRNGRGAGRSDASAGAGRVLLLQHRNDRGTEAAGALLSKAALISALCGATRLQATVYTLL